MLYISLYGEIMRTDGRTDRQTDRQMGLSQQ